MKQMLAENGSGGGGADGGTSGGIVVRGNGCACFSILGIYGGVRVAIKAFILSVTTIFILLRCVLRIRKV